MTATEPTLAEQIAVLEQAGYPDLAALCKTLRFGTRAVALLRGTMAAFRYDENGWCVIPGKGAEWESTLRNTDALLKEIDG